MLDAKTLNAFTFTRNLKSMLAESLEEKLNEGAAFDLLPSRLDEDAKSTSNKKTFMKLVSTYEKDFIDASKDSDEDLSKRGKEALKLVARLKEFSDDKFSAGVPKQYSTFLDRLYTYVMMLRDKAPVLNEDVDTSITPEFLDEIFEGMNPDEVEYISEHVRSDAIDTDWSVMNDAEKDVVIQLKELGRQFGSDPGAYASGVLRLTFKNKQAVIDFTTALEDEDAVDTYEIEAYREDMIHGFVEAEEYDLENIMFDKDFEFEVYVYLDPDLVSDMPFDAEFDEDELAAMDPENVEYISEVRRRIKINFRGKKKIKMQCRRGFKWVAAKKSCVKITGSEVALKRKAMRRMVRTKKAKGASLKVRVLRKTRKAKRFRKSMGVKTFSWSGLK